MTIIIGKIQQLDLFHKKGRIHCGSVDKSSGEKVVEFQFTQGTGYPTNAIKKAFSDDVRVVMAISEKGFIEFIGAVVEVGSND